MWLLLWVRWYRVREEAGEISKARYLVVGIRPAERRYGGSYRIRKKELQRRNPYQRRQEPSGSKVLVNK
jgi:hypothetical protein